MTLAPVQKVLHVIDSGGYYGAEAVLVELVAEQRRQGVDAIVCSIGLPGEGEKPLEKVLREQGLPCWVERMAAGWNLKGAQCILQRAKQEGINLLHSHGYKANILFGFMPRRYRKLPLVATLHGWTSVGGFSKMRIYEWLDAFSLRFMEGVAVVSEAMLQRSELAGRRLANLSVIQNGISACVPEIRPNDPVAEQLSRMKLRGPVIGSIGRLSEEKGFDVLLHAFALLKQQVPDVQLALMGAGRQEQALRALADSLSLTDDVWFAGYVADAGRYISMLDVYVNSSFTEGLPVTILEAMRAGCPIVASRVGGIPRVLENGSAGWLCQPGVVDDYVAGLKAGLAAGRSAPEVELARQKFEQHYSASMMAQQYSAWYLQVGVLSAGRHGS